MSTISLEDLGYTPELATSRTEKGWEDFEVGRVTSEHKERYTVRTPEIEYEAELLGNLRFTAESRSDFPAVGDWVALSPYDADKALIHGIYPRNSIIERQSVGKAGQKQIIATHIDVGLIVQAVNRDFNLNRLERYLTICHTSGVEPLIVLSKIDLIETETLDEIRAKISNRISDVSVVTVSNQQENGYASLAEWIHPGKTYCLLGSSGVGKSTLINHLAGSDRMKTGTISTSVNKGKHVTSHRELVLLDNGGILIDNPGMREVGIGEAESGLALTFEQIHALASSCRFADCTHEHEKGCAVIEAVDNGEIEEATYAHYHKLQKEKAHFESTVIEKRQKDKAFGKMIKQHKKARKQQKY